MKMNISFSEAGKEKNARQSCLAFFIFCHGSIEHFSFSEMGKFRNRDIRVNTHHEY